MVPKIPRCTVDMLTLPEMVGFFILYLKCRLDILNQVLYDETEDCGKKFIFDIFQQTREIKK